MQTIVSWGRSSVGQFNHPIDAGQQRAGQGLPHAGIIFSLAIAIWLAIVSVGIGKLWTYENTAGVASAAKPTWPSDSQIARRSDQPKLVVFAHPQCPCTRATVDELARLIRFCAGKVDCSVVFIKPEKFALIPDWEKTDLWSSASGIAGVSVLCDPKGTEANLFGAATSGAAILYGPDGQRWFRGGITASRGHSGDSLGKRSIIEFVTNGESQCSETSVFGCELANTPSDDQS